MPAGCQRIAEKATGLRPAARRVRRRGDRAAPRLLPERWNIVHADPAVTEGAQHQAGASARGMIRLVRPKTVTRFFGISVDRQPSGRGATSGTFAETGKGEIDSVP